MGKRLGLKFARQVVSLTPPGVQGTGELGVQGFGYTPTGVEGTAQVGTPTVQQVAPPSGSYLAPLYTLPTGITFNGTTGNMDGTVYDEGAFSLPGTVYATVSDSSFSTLQSAITAACAINDAVNRVIVVSGTYTGLLQINSKVNTGWLYIVSQAVYNGTFPRAAGQRVQTGDTASMFTLRTTDGEPCLAFGATGDNNYAQRVRVVGARCLFAAAAATPNYGILSIGSPSASFGIGSAVGQSNLNRVPREIVLDRCIIDGTTGNDVRRGIALNGQQCVVRECAVVGISNRSSGQDNQAIMGWNGPGPLKVINCYLEAAAENVMFGGGDPSISGLIPSDIEFRRNYLDKPAAWQSDGSYAKNVFETKNAQRVLVEDCVLGRTWFTDQKATFVIKSANQDGGASWSKSQDITVRYCRSIGPAPNAIDMTGGAGPSGTSAAGPFRIDFHHCLFESLSNGAIAYTPYYTPANDTIRQADHRIRHCTFAHPTSSLGYFINMQDSNPNTMNATMRYDDNVCINAGNPGIIGGGGTGATSLNNSIGVGEWTCANNAHSTSQMPSGNFGAPVFVDRASRNYRLATGSPGKAAAANGTDCGADIDTVLSRTSGVTTGL
jgi:hypothetical protein